MRIGAGLHALRRDPAVQRAAQEAIERAKAAWLARPGIALLRRELARHGTGAVLEHLPGLCRLMRSQEDAAEFCSGLVTAMTGVLSTHPFAQVPFRHQYSDRIALIPLLDEGRSILSLVLYEVGDRTPAVSACFGSGERHELCLAGRAVVRGVSRVAGNRGQTNISIARRVLEPGDVMAFDNARETKLVDSVSEGGLVQLRLSRAAENPPPACEYRLSDGALIHQAAGDRGESRRELAMALLGRMRRGYAVPAMQAAARSGAPHLRWQAVRECLALDTRRGFASLSAIADDPSDELAAAAVSLRTQLVAAHPQLGRLEAVPSPA